MLRTLGEHIFNRYIEIKRQEWEDYRVQVTPWELERYLAILASHQRRRAVEPEATSARRGDAGGATEVQPLFAIGEARRVRGPRRAGARSSPNAITRPTASAITSFSIAGQGRRATTRGDPSITAAGTITERTTNVSSSTPKATMKPISREEHEREHGERAERPREHDARRR